MREFIERRFLWLAAAPICLMVLLQVGSVQQESSTYDEGVHLAAGYRYWRTGQFTMNVEHPPLQKLLSAAPLLWVQPPTPADPQLLQDQSEYARAFLYNGNVDGDRLLLLGRLPSVGLTVALLCAVGWAARRYFGKAAALIAVWLCALDPNLIAHGRYVTNDVASALFYFLAVVIWMEYLRAPSALRLLGAGAVAGCAFSTKFSMLLLAPLLPALALVQWAIKGGGWRRAARGAGSIITVMVIAAAVVGLFYAPESWRVLRGRPIGVGAETLFGVTLPPHTYFTGLRTLLDHNREGHPAYLLGKISTAGWYYYFPVVLGVKSATAFLLLLIAAAGAACRALPAFLRRWRDSAGWVCLLIPALAYLAVAFTSHINLGVRHLLPVYPIFYVLGAAALCTIPNRRLLAGLALPLLCLQTAETIAIYPEYLPYFNLPAGGAKAGPAYLLDSNVDWGQDLKKLKRYIDRTSPGTICLEYFGSVDPAYYGIRPEYLPKTWDEVDFERMDCTGAISVTLLHDLYIRPGSYEWLRRRKPIGMAGSSIYLYDLHKQKVP